MNDTMPAQAGCSCGPKYADLWPDMTPAELAHVHDPSCPVRLQSMRRDRQRTRNGGAQYWELLLAQQAVSTRLGLRDAAARCPG